MTVTTIRKCTEYDIERLDHVARKFVKRHALFFVLQPEGSPWVKVSAYFENPGLDDRGEQLKKQWLSCFRRALGEPDADTIAWGYICRSEK